MSSRPPASYDPFTQMHGVHGKRRYSSNGAFINRSTADIVL